MNFIVQVEEFQFALLLADGDECADKLPQTRTVDVTDIGKVEKNLFMSVFKRSATRLRKLALGKVHGNHFRFQRLIVTHKHAAVSSKPADI